MSRYYSSSKPFEWMRKKLGIEKPVALPFGEWKRWDADLKRQRPIAFWLTETLPDWLEKPAEWVVDPLNDLRYYVKNRYFTQTHYLRTDLKPGDYHECDTRLLHGIFTTLVDFVEIDKAHMQVVWGEAQDRKKYHYPWWRRSHWLRWGQWRSAAAGLAYLHWEAGLVNEAVWYDNPKDPAIGQPTPQALAAREIMNLYEWWIIQRPARPDPHDAGGWTAVCDEVREKYGELFVDVTDPDLKARQDQALKLTHDLEQQYEDEDTDMLIRLMKIRRSLWT
jgi:hypothetical protein